MAGRGIGCYPNGVDQKDPLPGSKAMQRGREEKRHVEKKRGKNTRFPFLQGWGSLGQEDVQVTGLSVAPQGTCHRHSTGPPMDSASRYRIRSMDKKKILFLI